MVHGSFLLTGAVLTELVSLSLVTNPSHSEACNPVVLGKICASQHFNNDKTNYNMAMGVLLHDDTIFAGQGVVYKTMGFHTTL